MFSSRIPGFYKLSPSERLATVSKACSLREDHEDVLSRGGLDTALANRMVENVIGTLALPLGVAVNLTVNGRDVLVPMAVEEPSVVAAASHMGQVTRAAGGVRASADPGEMIGQIEIPAPRDPERCVRTLEAMVPRLLERAAELLPELVALGGGPRLVELRRVRYEERGFAPEERVVVHLVVDCLDAMGANMVNTACEGLAPLVEEITGERVGLRILSNLAARRLARATVDLPVELLATRDLDGAAVAEGIASAWRFAWADPYRAATHNKGILNGMDPVVIATGNDWRAMEAGAHAWAARSGVYKPLSTWRVQEGRLLGAIELPVQVGTVGGTLRMHPTVRANLAILGVRKAGELAEVIAAMGLVQNLGALRALATTGIQEGHMRMHARALAATVGASEAEGRVLVSRLVKERRFDEGFARSLLAAMRAARGVS
jgi:hydroxymethylglutaryl-CoA reductase